MSKDDLLVPALLLLVLGTICVLATWLGIWFWILLVLAVLGAGGYVVRTETMPAKRGKRAYGSGDYARALRFYVQAGATEEVRKCLAHYLPHWKGTDVHEVEAAITRPLVDATLLLVQLKGAIALARKHSVSETLLKGYEQNTEEALKGTLSTADKVVGFVSTGYEYKNVRETLQREGRSLKEIVAACEMAQSALAELTISSRSSRALERAEEGLSALSKAVIDMRDEWRK